MPIRIPNDLPATGTLQQENIFVMNERRAVSQRIRPLEIVLLNLMPTKIATETQLSRLLGNTPLQVNLSLMHTTSHKPKNISQEHMLSFYKSFDELKHRKFDGMVITGAPVEMMEFEPQPIGSFAEFDRMIERCYTDVSYAKKVLPSTLEGCVVRISDIIAYLGKDRQDAEKADILKTDAYENCAIGTYNAEIINNTFSNFNSLIANAEAYVLPVPVSISISSAHLPKSLTNADDNLILFMFCIS